MRIVFWLIALQVVGVLLAALAATIDIESIMASGGPLSASGLLISLVSFRKNRPVGFHFGLAAPTLSVFCFLVIYTLRLSPTEAQVPISMLLVACALIHLVAGYLAFQELKRGDGGDGQKLRFQFSIASLLMLMVIVSVFSGLCKTAGADGAVAGGVLAYAIVVAYFRRQFYKRCEGEMS